jgi:hypothetical protein
VQDAVELGDGSGVRMEQDDLVVALLGVVDLVGKTALAPRFLGVDRTAIGSDETPDLLKGGIACLVLEVGAQDKHEFVSLQ